MQIVADGITDNTQSLNWWLKQGGDIMLPSGIIAFDGELISGNKFCTAQELLSIPVTLGAGFQNTKYAKPFNLIGQSGTVLLCRNTDTSKAALSVLAQGRNTDFTVSSISNVVFRGKGFGVVASYVSGMRLDNVKFDGFTDGLVMNNVYGFNLNNLTFQNCTRSAYLIQSHGGLINNTWLYKCDTGFEVISNNIIFSFYYANYCGIGLIVRSGNNIFTSMSFESNTVSEAQLIIGNDLGSLIHGNIFNGLTIAANPNSKCGIWWKKTAGNTTINGYWQEYNKARVDTGSSFKLATTKF